MNRSGITEKLAAFADDLVGHLRGGLDLMVTYGSLMGVIAIWL